MDCRTKLRLFTLAVLCAVSSPNPAPQYYPLPFPGQQSYSPPQDSVYSGTQDWPQTSQSNFSHPNPNYLDPLNSPAAEELLKNDIPRQLYGVPPPPISAYPQIYKLDNLIIIANPPQVQPQPCIPQRPPPQFPRPGGSGSGSGGSSDDGLDNRFGEEPSKCTWAIVACCSPGSNNIRYNCFELLGCPGFFFDNSPCDSKTVMAAASAALAYYRTASNATNASETNIL